MRSCAPSALPDGTSFKAGCSELDIKDYGGKFNGCFCDKDLCNGAGTVAISMISLVISAVLVKIL